MKWMVFTGLLFAAASTHAQTDSTPEKKWSLHAQTTVVPQHVFHFHSPYVGENSFLPTEPTRTSVTATLFGAWQPNKHWLLVFNPEMAAGKGLSKTTGVAGFPNGEIYRVGNPNPQLFVARAYVQYKIPLSARRTYTEEDANQVGHKDYTDFFAITAGKLALTDFFDDSPISHDPRTQFMNWSLMGNGAWDYPANVRGYTYALMLQLMYKDWGIRLATTAMPSEANGSQMQWKGSDASGNVLEIEKTHLWKKNDRIFGTLHAGVFLNKANMGNYATSTKTGLITLSTPDITDSRAYGRSKYGFYASIDNHYNLLHHFIRYSWNDGANETWAFTEIDRSFATGFLLDGIAWKRKNDHLGLATVINGISKDHRNYLAAGGAGFMLGDGRLNYGTEQTIELYYACQVWKTLFVTPDLQYIIHPGYNKDRGPATVFGLRFHVEL